MNNKDLKMRVDDLIALCYIIDEFEEFNSRLVSIATTRDNLHYDLGKISQGKSFFNSKEVKNFYQENKYVIDTINQYSNITTFIMYNYSNVKNNSHSNILALYQYILANKNNLIQIINLLEKIKELGFEELNFNESSNFTNERYQIDSNINNNFDKIAYLDNMEVIPNYEIDKVKYRSSASNYKILIKTNPLRGISKYGNAIYVNSLLFDINRLPEDITKENTFDKIIELQNSKKEEKTCIRNSIDLSISISDLQDQIDSSDKALKELNNKELLEILSNIRTEIKKMEAISLEYNNSVMRSIPSITEEVLEEEKQLYLRRRFFDSIDLC